jgi:hypothetical protein
MLKSLILATALLPSLTFTQSQQLPQPRRPGQWCPEGWSASGSYCVPGGLAGERKLLHPLNAMNSPRSPEQLSEGRHD